MATNVRKRPLGIEEKEEEGGDGEEDGGGVPRPLPPIPIPPQ